MKINYRVGNWSFFVIGATLGTIAGAVAGILLAPQSGSQTREQLGGWLKERRDRGTDLLAKIREEGLHKKEQLTAALEAGRNAYEEVGKRA